MTETIAARTDRRSRGHAGRGWLVIGVPLVVVQASCFATRPVPPADARAGMNVEVRYAVPESLSVRAGDAARYPVRAVRGRLLRAAATGDTIWLRPDSVDGTWTVERAGATDAATAPLAGPWADTIVVTPTRADLRFTKRQFSRRRTLAAAAGVALLWVAYVVYDLSVNGPFKES